MREKERKKRGNREKERKKLNNREKRKKQWNVPVLTSESGPSNYERKSFLVLTVLTILFNHMNGCMINFQIKLFKFHCILGWIRVIKIRICQVKCDWSESLIITYMHASYNMLIIIGVLVTKEWSLYLSIFLDTHLYKSLALM
jgi:hypothetical protein